MKYILLASILLLAIPVLMLVVFFALVVITSRKKEINGHIIEEYFQDGDYPVYVDNKRVYMSFERACELAGDEKVVQSHPVYAP